MRIIIFTIFVLAMSFPAFAQREVGIYHFNAAGFFVAVVAGVILASAFQLFLTNLSAAAGLSAARVMTDVSSVRSKRDKKDKTGHGSNPGNQGNSGNPGNPGNPTVLSDYTDPMYSTMRQISTGFGLTAMITASISLFLASWLALSIIGPTTITFAIIVALVIWGLSYLITFALELKVGTTMIGAIAYVAKQSFQSITQATAKLMSRSEGRRMEDQAKAVCGAVRSELFGHIDLQRQIKEYIHDLKPDYTPRDYRNELESLIDNLKVEEFVSQNGGPGGIQEVVRQVKTPGDGMSRENARGAANRLRRTISETREEAGTEKVRHEKVIDSAVRATGLSHSEA